MNYNKLIRKLRRDQDLTQRELGEKCGLKQQYINQIEQEKVNPTITTYEKIINALGYRIEITR